MSRPKSSDEFARYYQDSDIASSYDRDRSRTLKHQVVRQREREFFCEHVPQGGSVLELGIGTGEIAAAVSAKARLLGIDSSAAMLEHAKTRLPGVRIQELSMFDLAKLDERFDTIYTSRVFLHLNPTDLETMLRVCADRLVVGGRIAFDLQRPNPVKWLLDRVERRKMFNYRYTAAAITELVARVPALRLTQIVAFEHMALLGMAAFVGPLNQDSKLVQWLVRADRQLAEMPCSANRWGVVCERI